MYNKFLIAVSQTSHVNKLDQAFSDINSVLPKINSKLQIGGENLVIFKVNKENGTYDIFCRYSPNIDIYNDVILQHVDDIDTDAFNFKELKLGEIIIDVGKIRHHVIETDDNILGQIEVKGYLDSSLTKEEFKYATDLLYYIRKYLASFLKGKYVVSYIDPFDISKEIYQSNDKWVHSQYDEGIFDLISQIQERIRNAFLEHIRDALIRYDICSNRGYINYAETINKEYSKVSDMYFESKDFKKNIETYIYELKNNNDLVSKVNNIIDSYSFDSLIDLYIESVRKNYDFSNTRENEYSVISFQFNEAMIKAVTNYINTIFTNLFSLNKKNSSNLYNTFFNRIIAITLGELARIKYDTEGERKQKKVIDEAPDNIKELITENDLSSSESESRQEQQSDAVNKSDAPKQTYYTEDARPSKPNLSETDVSDDNFMLLKDAIEEYATMLGFTVKFDNTGNLTVKDKDGRKVDSDTFMDYFKQEYKGEIQDKKELSESKNGTITGTTIYEPYLKTPNSYNQFHTKAGSILDALININNYVNDFNDELTDKDFLDIKKYVSNAKELPQGIRDSLLVTLQTSDSDKLKAFKYFKAVLTCQIEILNIFDEEYDYKIARNRISAVLNIHRDLAKYFRAGLDLNLPDKSVDKFVQDTKNTPYLLAKQFRRYLSKLGWKFDEKDSYFYKLNSKGKRIRLSVDRLNRYLADFNIVNKSDLKLEDIFTQRNFDIEPINLVFEDDEFTHFLLNNINSGIGNINKKLNEIANEINSL